MKKYCYECVWVLVAEQLQDFLYDRGIDFTLDCVPDLLFGTLYRFHMQLDEHNRQIICGYIEGLLEAYGHKV